VAHSFTQGSRSPAHVPIIHDPQRKDGRGDWGCRLAVNPVPTDGRTLPLTRRQDIVVLLLREHVRGEISRPRAEPTVRIVHRL